MKKLLSITFASALLVLSSCGESSENASKDAAKDGNAIQYSPCDCADISYKVAKNGGVDVASDLDNAKLEACNELMGSTSFSSKVNECPSYLKLMNLYKF